MVYLKGGRRKTSKTPKKYKKNRRGQNPNTVLPSFFSPKLQELATFKHGDLPKQSWIDALEYFNHRCVYCAVRFNDKSIRPNRDHVIPRALSGKTNIYNIIPCCARCNNKKGKIRVEDFASRNAQEKIAGYFELVMENQTGTLARPTTNKAKIKDEFDEAMRLIRLKLAEVDRVILLTA